MYVYTVHSTRPDDLGAVEIVFTTEDEARAYARDRSGDHLITSSSVTRYAVGELGTRTPVTWYVDRREQPISWGRQIYPEG